MITEVKEFTDYKEVNDFIKKGWKLLQIAPSQEKIIYILAFCNYDPYKKVKK